MKKLILLLMVASVVLLTAGTVQASSDYVDAGSGLWSDVANWTNGIPTSADWAKISNASGVLEQALINGGYAAVTGKTHIGYANGGVVTIDNGSLTTTVGAQDGDLLLSKQGGNGTINLIDGSITVGRDFEVGQDAAATGLFNMSGGTVTVHDDFEINQIAGGAGIVNLDGGVIQLTGLYEGDGHLRMYAGSLLNFGGDGSGMLILAGDEVSRVNGYIANGWITSGLGGVAVDFDGVDTTVTAVPEPATMVLLGLGGLLIRKRR